MDGGLEWLSPDCRPLVAMLMAAIGALSMAVVALWRHARTSANQQAEVIRDQGKRLDRVLERFGQLPL